MSQIDVFVLGLDEANLRTLGDVPGSVRYRFHPLLSPEQLQRGEISVPDLLAAAQDELDSFEGDIGAIVGYWDFPVTTMIPLLCDRYGLPSATLEAVVKCEHKYWSRLEQAKVIDEHPRFGLVDLDAPAPPTGLRYPMWLKPVKSFSSELAYRVDDDAEFTESVKRIRAGIDRVGKPFEYFLEQLDLPAEVAAAGGRACLAEEAMSGAQAATEGYVHGGEVTVYGTLDSLNYPEHPSSFLRHQYPCQLPAPMVRRMEDISARIIGQIGLDNSTFSVEFFCDTETGEVNVLEINPRHSQSHAELFEYVDGVPNHHLMISLGLGENPDLPSRTGPYELAAKWYYRRFRDGVVRRVPSKAEVDQAQLEIPGVVIDVIPAAGERLSELDGQDSYSYELAHIYVGADSEAELQRKYEQAVRLLPFEFDDDDEFDDDEEEAGR
ncbi:Carbamoyl-phosphate synthase L chain, ATP binding domain [Saccharomonospora marina XMU15]|uniref:Carbamoyl-phosphate synthase L chain, ATP binding domain n=1 Tax=Saccharomonospora marina XMU15 TaxID=882083 RepID=H5X3E1_9PSEU|nr:ATP-grasp domain-containing protein [Saccharomonospora marina]EHR49875.1 Carbamoyl-phosphate synthase L chain, ATP binding domain [Saccharomonospora marina XMU15]